MEKRRFGKIWLCAAILVSVCLVAKLIPSMARVKNRVATEISTVWDGSVANGYRSGKGTKSDPYIIATGAELAYFGKMLEITNYSGTYFTLSNDILLNEGIFSYDGSLKYTLNKSSFYLDSKTGNFYDTSDLSGVKIGTVNSFKTLKNFKGHFDGKSYTIYGAFINGENDEIGLFSNLEGNITDLYVTNASINEGNVTGLVTSAKNATLANVVFNGVVIGENEDKVLDKSIMLDDYTVDGSANILVDDAELRGFYGLRNLTLSGKCDADFLIDGESVSCVSGQFETGLNPLKSNFEVASSVINNLLELKVNVSSVGNIAAGIVGYGENITLKNVVNKAFVKGNSEGAGLVGVAVNKLVISNSYNNGNVDTLGNHGALVGRVYSLSALSSINNSYNDGDDIGLVGMVVGSQDYLSITNSFDIVSNGNLIRDIQESVVNLNGVYGLQTNKYLDGVTTGNVVKTSKAQLMSRDYLINNLHFSEFVDLEDTATNSNNVWIYEDGYLPILYVDDIKNPFVTLNLGNYSWNNLGFDDKKINFSSSVAFAINDANDTRPIKESYYYISKSAQPLTKTQIDAIDTWTKYDNIVSISEDGFYVLYVKAYDYDGNEVIINSDVLVVDTFGSDVLITLGERKWSLFSEDLDSAFIDDNAKVEVSATDDLSGVKYVQYYVTDAKLNNDELDNLNWSNYEEAISIDKLGTYVIYVRVTDNALNETIINTDYIIYGGYTLNKVVVASEEITDASFQISSGSKLEYNFSYQDHHYFDDGDHHNVVFNRNVPNGTKLILMDNISKKVYSYIVNSDSLVIPFTSFSVLGKGNMYKNFQEKTGDIDKEDYTVVVDFSDTIKPSISDLTVSIDVRDKNAYVSRSTIKNTLKTLSVIENADANVTLRSTYVGDGIKYNVDSLELIDLSLGLQNVTNEFGIIRDSSILSKQMGIAIKLVNKDGVTIDKSNMRNIEFKIDGEYYSPDSDGVTRIKIGDASASVSKTLMVLTSASNATLSAGEYYLSVTPILSYDGMYGGISTSENIVIPVIFDNALDNNETYSFKIESESDYRVLYKKDGVVSLNYEVISDNSIKNSNVRVMLYKKDKLTAYDQKYSLIDLNDYLVNPLNAVTANVYYALTDFSSGNKFSLNIDLARLEANGYEIVFALYDDSKKVGMIKEKFIVR